MQWLSDSILSMWDWVFGFWADGMGMIQEILTTSPDTLGGGVVWSTVRMIFSAILGVGYALVVLFFSCCFPPNTMFFIVRQHLLSYQNPYRP